jgi:hypothetical protein
VETFELFRYQLLPLSQHQQELFDQTYSAEQIRRRKNYFFEKILAAIPIFKHRGMEILRKVEFHDHRVIVFKLSTYKKIDRYTAEFQRERLESWPHVTVVIDNDPNIQTISISRNLEAFSSSKTVANLLEYTFNVALRKFGLSIHIRERFEQNDFWALVKDYSHRIKRVRFEMVSPNMANISHVLKIDLKQLNRESNSQRTTIELEAVDGASLELSQENQLVAGCVEYASEGGGDIAVKITGMKKVIRTSSTVKSVKIDELQLNLPPAELVSVLKALLGS